MFDLVLTTIWLLIPAYTPNNFAVLVGGGRPIDFGKNFIDGKRILGNGKTVRGFIGGLAGGILCANLQYALEKLFNFEFPCLIITRGLEPYPEMVRISLRKKIPILGTELATAEFISRLNQFLEDHLAPSISLHGVLIDVYGIGVLILGQSGIGKSETALDLVLRGHRLVADDIVEIRKRGQRTLIGKGAEMIKYHMEIRGLGIINIKDLFGIASIRDRKKIELVIELVEWDPNQDYDRLGLEEETYTILGVEVPHLTIPVRPGRNLTTIIEVAARNQLLKIKGYHSARDFQRRLLEELLQKEEDEGSLSEEIE